MKIVNKAIEHYNNHLPFHVKKIPYLYEKNKLTIESDLFLLGYSNGIPLIDNYHMLQQKSVLVLGSSNRAYQLYCNFIFQLIENQQPFIYIKNNKDDSINKKILDKAKEFNYFFDISINDSSILKTNYFKNSMIIELDSFLTFIDHDFLSFKLMIDEIHYPLPELFVTHWVSDLVDNFNIPITVIIEDSSAIIENKCDARFYEKEIIKKIKNNGTFITSIIPELYTQRYEISKKINNNAEIKYLFTQNHKKFYFNSTTNAFLNALDNNRIDSEELYKNNFLYVNESLGTLFDEDSLKPIKID